jgi:hypothetical protein
MLSVSFRRSVILLLKPEQRSKRKEVIRLQIAWQRLLWNSKQKLPTSRGDSVFYVHKGKDSVHLQSSRLAYFCCTEVVLFLAWSCLSAAANIRDNSGGKVNILGGQGEGRIVCEHVYNSKWLPGERERERERELFESIDTKQCEW